MYVYVHVYVYVKIYYMYIYICIYVYACVYIYISDHGTFGRYIMRYNTIMKRTKIMVDVVTVEPPGRLGTHCQEFFTTARRCDVQVIGNDGVDCVNIHTCVYIYMIVYV